MRQVRSICIQKGRIKSIKGNMGTRHLIAAKTGGEYKIAQYGQWDGYPQGQGIAVLRFLHNFASHLPAVEEKLRELSFYSKEEYAEEILDKYWENEGGGNYYLSYGSPEKERWDRECRHLSRDAGSEILDMVMNSKVPLKLRNELSFAGDSLFCEWAYVIDFDTGTFEVFEGLNKSPVVEGRFTTAEFGVDRDGQIEYHPVKLVFSWPLDNISELSEWHFLEQFTGE